MTCRHLTLPCHPAGHGFLGGAYQVPSHHHHHQLGPLPPLLLGGSAGGLHHHPSHHLSAMDAPPVVQTGAAGLATVLWRDTASSDRLAHHDGAAGRPLT